MKKIKINSGCDNHLIGYFEEYTIRDYVTKNGVKCKLYEIKESDGSFSGYNDFHYTIEEVNLFSSGNFTTITGIPNETI